MSINVAQVIYIDQCYSRVSVGSDTTGRPSQCIVKDAFKRRARTTLPHKDFMETRVS